MTVSSREVSGIAGAMGQKWGKSYANQCHLMPNETNREMSKKPYGPLLSGL